MRNIAVELVCLMSVLQYGCSSESKDANKGENVLDGSSSGGSSSGGAGGGGGATAPEGAKLKWQVQELSASMTPPRPEGVEVCVRNRDDIPCVKTGADGLFEIAGLPRDSVLDLTLEIDGYLPTLKTIETSNIDMDNTGNPPIALVLEGAPPTDFGFTVDMTKGVIGFFVIGPAEGGFGALPGSVVSISPKEGNGPIYFGGAPNEYDVTATSTYSFGGNFYNLDEGEYKITVAAPSGNDCAGISFPFSGWGVPVSGEPAVMAHAVPGYYTSQMGLFCTPSFGGGTDAGAREAGAADAADD